MDSENFKAITMEVVDVKVRPMNITELSLVVGVYTVSLPVILWLYIHKFELQGN